MIYDPIILDTLQGLEPRPWAGLVYRHMLNNYPPTRANTRGARWNPPDVQAIYTSCDRETALAEAEYRLSLEPVQLRVRRVMYTLKVQLKSVLDITSNDILRKLGINAERLTESNFTTFQHIGGATNWLGHDGMLVPSARTKGINLVIYPLQQDSDLVIEEVQKEVIVG